MSGPARRLYVALADKKRQQRSWHEYSLDELRQVLGVSGRYTQWSVLRRAVLLPALASIQEFGTVKVEYAALNEGRRVVGVRLKWQRRDPREAAETVEENARAKVARGKRQTDPRRRPHARCGVEAHPGGVPRGVRGNCMAELVLPCGAVRGALVSGRGRPLYAERVHSRPPPLRIRRLVQGRVGARRVRGHGPVRLFAPRIRPRGLTGRPAQCSGRVAKKETTPSQGAL